MPWLSSRPPGGSSAARRSRVEVDPLGADVLDHADAGDRVEALAGEVAVVHDADLDPVGDAGLARRARGRRAACGSESVMPTTSTPWRSGGVDRRSCPSRSRRRARARPALQRRASCRPARASPPAPPRASSPRARRSRSCRSSTRRGRARRTPAAGRSGGGPRGRRAPCVRRVPRGRSSARGGAGGRVSPFAASAAASSRSRARAGERRRLPVLEQVHDARRCRRPRARRSRRRGRGRAGRARAARGRRRAASGP